MKNGAATAPYQSIIPLHCAEFCSLTWTLQRAISSCLRVGLHYQAGKLDLGDHCGELVEDLQVLLCDVGRWAALITFQTRFSQYMHTLNLLLPTDKMLSSTIGEVSESE